MEETALTINGYLLSDVLKSHQQWVEDDPNGQRCILDNLTLTDTVLRGVNLRGAIVRGTTLLDADLSGANLSTAVCDFVDFERAMLSGVDLSAAQISDSQF